MSTRATWTSWVARDDAKRDPYSEWIESIDGESGYSRLDLSLPRSQRDLDFAFPLGLAKDALFFPGSSPNREALMHVPSRENGHPTRTDVQRGMTDTVDEYKEEAGLKPVIPTFAANVDFDPNDSEDWQDWVPDVRAEDAPDKDAIVVGVIDRGIALGHRAQQFDDGSSRLLGAWQQMTDRVSVDEPNSPSNKLPFGMAFLKPDIDAALQQARAGNKGDALDHEMFNRLVGSENYYEPYAHRELGRSAAHGTHVLDTATGIDPNDANAQTFGRLVRPAIVNLPDRNVVGLSSHNLSYFVVLGIYWIVNLADRYWFEAHEGNHTSSERHGYPIVINLSFAKQAGSKDGKDIITRTVDRINEARANAGMHPVYLVLPAGNDNLERGHAHFLLDGVGGNGNQIGTIDWRIVPGDQSSNYVEVWYDAGGADTQDGTPCDLVVTIEDPTGRTSTLEPKISYASWLQKDRPTTGGDVPAPEAAILVMRKEAAQDGSSGTMVRYLICVGPTQLHDDLSPEAPAGIWRITLTNKSEQPRFVSLDIQTDQSDQPEARWSQPSYFDDGCYERFHPESGQLLDSYNYPPKSEDGLGAVAGTLKDHDNFLVGSDPLEKNPGPVRRHGTLNAIGAFARIKELRDKIPDPFITGGYRWIDGKPAPYSSTGLSSPTDDETDPSSRPLASFASDDSTAHIGRLAAGSTDGSVRTMQGTSFACAQMTRQLANWLRDNANAPIWAAWDSIEQKAQASEQGQQSYERFAAPNKAGSGRLDMAPRSKVDRLFLDK